MSDTVRPIRPDVTPLTDVEREFLDFTRSLFGKLESEMCAISVVVHGVEGDAMPGVYSIPNLPVRWIAGAGAAVLSHLAAEATPEEPPAW